jgi:hypothetical protein
MDPPDGRIDAELRLGMLVGARDDGHVDRNTGNDSSVCALSGLYS